MNSSRKRFQRMTTVVLLCLTGILLIIKKDQKIEVKYYEIFCNIQQNIRIVQLTDLHNKKFGKENEKLIQKVYRQKPDLIFMTGDMINAEDDLKDIEALVMELSKIAPVYYSYGNHEMHWEKGTEKELRESLTKAGAIVLNFEFEDVEIKGEAVRIGGYYGYYRAPHMRTDNESEQSAELKMADEFENTSYIKLLLCHIPTAWIDWSYLDQYPVDVVFSGHYHGGQIRFPILGGLYAPYVGWFPENTIGKYSGEKGTCILSAGLGSETWIPRINNPSEISVIDLKVN